MVKHNDDGSRYEATIVEAIYCTDLGENKAFAQAKAHVVMDTAMDIKQSVYEFARLDEHIDKMIGDGYIITYRNPALDYDESRPTQTNKP
jgi:hypothetical protein